MSKNKEITFLQDEADFTEKIPENEIKESESELESDKSLEFEKLENIVRRLEHIKIKPEIEIKEPESKSKIGIVIFVLLFVIGIGGYFTLKSSKKA